MKFKIITAQKNVYCFVTAILLLNTRVNPEVLSSFVLLEGTPQFTSSSLDKDKWSSMTREYCFFKKELSFELLYEFSPMPIPAFKITNSVSDVYMTVDVDDQVRRLRFQKLIDAWKSFYRLKANEKICLSGAYLPADDPKAATYIMIEEIKSKNLKLALKDFLLAESNLD